MTVVKRKERIRTLLRRRNIKISSPALTLLEMEGFKRGYGPEKMVTFVDCFSKGVGKFASKRGQRVERLKITARNFRAVMREKPQSC